MKQGLAGAIFEFRWRWELGLSQCSETTNEPRENGRSCESVQGGESSDVQIAAEALEVVGIAAHSQGFVPGGHIVQAHLAVAC